MSNQQLCNNVDTHSCNVAKSLIVFQIRIFSTADQFLSTESTIAVVPLPPHLFAPGCISDGKMVFQVAREWRLGHDVARNEIVFFFCQLRSLPLIPVVATGATTGASAGTATSLRWCTWPSAALEVALSRRCRCANGVAHRPPVRADSSPTSAILAAGVTLCRVPALCAVTPRVLPPLAATSTAVGTGVWIALCAHTLLRVSHATTELAGSRSSRAVL